MRLSSALVTVCAAMLVGCGGRAQMSTEAPEPVTRPAPAPAPAPAPVAVTRPEPKPEPRQAQPAPIATAPAAPAETPRQTVSAEAWRPAWWVPGEDGRGGTARGSGITAAAGMGTETDVLAARRAALEAAMARLETALGKSAAAEAALSPDLETKIDTLQLPDGRYRAFVVVSVPAP